MPPRFGLSSALGHLGKLTFCMLAWSYMYIVGVISQMMSFSTLSGWSRVRRCETLAPRSCPIRMNLEQPKCCLGLSAASSDRRRPHT